tara:strand:+ start:51 stop:395 length:345 start_codon:yes stop_codon:yes gene_type:complete
MNGNTNAALILIDQVLEEIESGFVACNRCGDQEDTKNLDFVDDIKSIKSELMKSVETQNKANIEQRIVGIEMLVEKFKPTNGLHAVFEMTSDKAYDYCDELFGGDSQHVRGKYK